MEKSSSKLGGSIWCLSAFILSRREFSNGLSGLRKYIWPFYLFISFFLFFLLSLSWSASLLFLSATRFVLFFFNYLLVYLYPFCFCWPKVLLFSSIFSSPPLFPTSFSSVPCFHLPYFPHLFHLTPVFTFSFFLLHLVGYLSKEYQSRPVWNSRLAKINPERYLGEPRNFEQSKFSWCIFSPYTGNKLTQVLL